MTEPKPHPQTNREAHEEAAGMGLCDEFFRVSNIDPDAPVPAESRPTETSSEKELKGLGGSREPLAYDENGHCSDIACPCHHTGNLSLEEMYKLEENHPPLIGLRRKAGLPSAPAEIESQPHELRSIRRGFDCKCGKWSTDLLSPANGLRQYADHLESLLLADSTRTQEKP